MYFLASVAQKLPGDSPLDYAFRNSVAEYILGRSLVRIATFPAVLTPSLSMSKLQLWALYNVNIIPFCFDLQTRFVWKIT